jgi:hypothetical protein
VACNANGWSRSGTTTGLANSGDNVVIGTSSPSGVLTVVGHANANDAATFVPGAGPSSSMRVGVGTTNPNFLGDASRSGVLHVVSPLTPAVAIEQTAASGFAPRKYDMFVGAGSGQWLLYDENASAYRIAVDVAGNVAIGLSVPSDAARLEVAGGIKLQSLATGTCAPTQAGVMQYVAGATGVADTLQMCMKSSANTYSWRTIVTG